MPRNNIAEIVEEQWNLYMERVKEALRQEATKALQETYAELFVVVNDKVHKLFEDVIQDFYSDYTPDYYDRGLSLYNILNTKVSQDSLEIWFNPEAMTHFRSEYGGEDGLYDQVFRHGWHGGAGSGDDHPSLGHPYWRTPVPYYTHWGREAAIAPVVPLDEFKRRINEYQNTDMLSAFMRIWNERASKIKIDL